MPEDDVIVYRWQFCRDEWDITGDPYALDDATAVRAWEGKHGDFCLMEVEKTSRGLWRFGSCDSPIAPSWYRRRFGTPTEALQWLGQRRGVRYMLCGSSD